MKYRDFKSSIKKYLFEFFFVLLPVYEIACFFNSSMDKYGNILLVLLFIFIQYLFNQYKNKRINKGLLCLSIIYSLMYFYGTLIDKNFTTEYNFLHENGIKSIFYLYSFTIFIYFCLIKIHDLCIDIKKSSKNSVLNRLSIKKVIFLFLIVFISYIPYLIAFFPGLLSPDSFAQVSQAVGDSSLSNHHPVLHTLFLGVFLNIGKCISDLTLGVALYSIAQMLIMTGVFTYLLVFTSRNNSNKIIFLLSVLFYTLVPVFGFYSVTMWKDVLFGCFALLLMIGVYKYIVLNLKDAKTITFIIFSIILTSLFRSNGIYVTVALSLILLLFFKGQRKLTTYVFLIPSIICVIIVGPIYNAAGITKGNLVESLSIPLEQISNVVANDLPIDKKTTKFLNRLVGVDIIKEKYSLVSIDGVKFDPNFDNKYLEKHKLEFFEIWFKLLAKYPSVYIQTYMKSTNGFWYIESKGYSAHVWTIDGNNYNLKTNKNDLTNKMIEYHENFYSFPIVKYLMEPAVMIVTIMFAITSSIILNKKKYIYPLLVPVLVWGTIMIATPVSYQTRYVFGLLTTFPFVIYIIYNMYYNLDNIKRKVGKKK